MKRLFKWIFWIFVFPLLALFLLAWAVVEFYPQDKLRARVAQELGRRLNRQIEIGPIHLAWNGLTIDDLRLSEVPTFRAGTLVAAKGLRLGWGLGSLLKGIDVRKKFITRSSGHFHVDSFRNPHYSAQNFSIRWSLTDMDPTWSHLNGWAKLEQGTGLLQNVDQLMAKSPSAKIALTPVLALMNLEKLGILKLGLPNLRHWPIQSVHGNYLFKNGRMSIEPFTITSSQLDMGTTGAVDLSSGNLMLDVQLKSPKSMVGGALDAKLRVTGTLSHPKVDLSSLKKQAFQATLQGAGKDIDKNLKNLFRK